MKTTCTYKKDEWTFTCNTTMENGDNYSVAYHIEDVEALLIVEHEKQIQKQLDENN